MYLQFTFELTLTLDSEKFNKLLNRVYNRSEHLDNDEYVDSTLVSKGITVMFRDSQYKKKIKLSINPAWVLDDDKPEHNTPKLIRKLDTYISDYFNSKYTLDDFSLTGMILTTDINVRSRAKLSDYLKVLKRVGKIKGFSQPSNSWLNDKLSFCLEGNSNGLEFWLYDLKGILTEQLKEAEYGRKQLKSIVEKAEGLIRAEVRLTEPKSIRAYTDKNSASEQITELSQEREKIFLDTFMRAVPFGDFYKKEGAVEIIRKEVTDTRLKRRMLRLLDLIPEKKSLLLAQKALNCRKVDEVMEMFNDIQVSPVCISKRHDVKKLDNIYKFM